MRKQVYITPILSIISFQQSLLYDASADNKEGEDWGGDYAKEHLFFPDDEEDDNDDIYRIIDEI